ncbi:MULTISPECIES: branched-chain amino acid ABC transporter permease [Terrabacter]|jgi:branched-chain amino acid transport system permease protein|uniref:Branched-chain amino acid ABC transporter permease n=1 Tax=Terrabacter tumescens TaxID=60443 RepID=A0ABQ2IAZ3_9MICO|nr:branched-chain amino acid ABC transporter permease [Terrabacter tumescens]WVM95067.1 branched-chain amino acid ABC transporter permease [Terrabacter sp. C0L_2]GGN05070.1 branched-chain amino acid ABC transporter permease [Terrabacter tumescens]
MSTPTSAPAARKPATRGFKERVDHLPRSVKIVLWVLFALFLFLLPLLNIPFITTEGSDFGGVLFTVATYVLVALGLNIVVGYAGLLDLGYVGFYAVGAYTVGVLTSEHAHLSWVVVVPIAIVVAMVSGVILGAPTLRVRGDYLAIVTLGFGEIVRLTLVNSQWLGGAQGISDIPKPPSAELFEVPSLDWSSGAPVVDLDTTSTFLKFGINDFVPYYWLALGIIGLVLLFDILVKSSRVGRAWEATREDEDAAELMGVPTFRFKLLAFALGAAIGGLSGALFATKAGFISPDSFQLLLSILFLAAVVVGGAGNRWGVIVGAIVVGYFPERFRDFADFRVLVFGLALMLLAIFRPQGLLPPRRTVRAKRADDRQAVLEEGEASA